ncbi:MULTISPECIES: glycerol-3-phosphate 1-O-acyltransferase PlsY [Bacillaceae]|uniref:Glycerol-3-phosphate acyltransferase n=1 Tax=Evansella alkalicola TaxID=745819 RepID=A0ABS6JZF0_9BACI|nr:MULTISPECIES: glycerol-3-phosphate 1-O-acyltransferase PlsY [Bacillaceae]MBU9723965.1 glycerol-3-phosphate 1-O-acyltransferase PlsY [Bacillus alkalicola]
MTAIISILLSYLLGAISFSYVIGKKLKQVDIRQHGSGNAGATNTLRVLGVGPAVVVLLLDCAKGIAAVFLGLWLTDGNTTIAAASGLAAILGHNWPVYYGFRGGKGVATTIGVLATLIFAAALISGVIAIIAILITRYVSLGSILFVLGSSIITFFFGDYFGYASSYIYFVLIIAVLTIWRHRANIERLMKGNESKLGSK